MRLHYVQGRQAQVRGPRGYRTCAGRRRRARGASGALNAAQTLCLNSASLRRGVWRLTLLLLKLLPLHHLRGGRALRRLWMPLRLRLRLRMTIESRARCRRIYRNTDRQIQAYTDEYTGKIQANMNSPKSAYVPVCGCSDHENVHIFVTIQANTGSDHENVHIFVTIQANTGRLRS